MDENIVEVEELVKSYGSVRAVRGISFSVKRGSLFSFLGENGAGKSTTINILCSILKKDGGTVRIGGFDLDARPEKIKPFVGVVFQGTVLDDLLTVGENLAVRAAFYGIRGQAWKRRLSELTELLGLSELLSRPFGKLSGGQRRRADIARGLVADPKLLVLDEPTTGLDPQTRKSVWGIIRGLQKETGMTVFLTTHYMEEAEGADRVVILDGGKIAADGTPAALKDRYSSCRLRLYGEEAPLSAALSAAGLSFVREGEALCAQIKDGAAARAFLAANPGISDFEFLKGSMDDVFLSVTGRSLAGGAQA